MDAPTEPVSEGEAEYRVKIADPFIELHTGPGGGYPIYYVIDRGVEVRILRRKTDWYKLVTNNVKTCWASREQMTAIKSSVIPASAIAVKFV